LKFRNCILAFFGASLLAGVTSSALAAGYPDRPVTIVSTGPGGSTDTFARVIAKELSEIWGQAVIVKNKPGAGGIVSTMTVARAAPDGYTLLINSASVVVSTATRLNPGYDVAKDFEPVAMVGKGPLLLVARPGLAANNLNELFGLAKKTAGHVTYASTGAGSVSHLVPAMMFRLAGVNALHVPYTSGAHATAALAGGMVDLYFGTVSASLPLVKSGRLKAIALTSEKRQKFAPEIPTMEEEGLANFHPQMWWAFLAPKGTPKDVVEEINREVNKVIQRPNVIRFLNNEGVSPVAETPEELGAFIHKEKEFWTKTVSDIHFVRN
jgi:tripartite-type tricarboxylate transporter receptor subunit TctC